MRWESAGATVLAVHGAFDGASAWNLRNEMDDSQGREFVIDLTHAVEAFDFAAHLLAMWARGAARTGKRLRFLPGAPEHAALLRAHGLEVLAEEEDTAFAPILLFPVGRPVPLSGAQA